MKRSDKQDENPSEIEGTKDLLLQAGIKLFSRSGFDGTSVKDIAEEAGVNISLVSYHFKGKEGLYRACLEQFGKHRLRVAERILKEPESVEEMRIRFDMFVSEILECYSQDASLCQMIHRECEMALPHAQDIFQNTFLKAFYTLVAFLKTASHRELISRTIDPEVAASLIFGSLNHLSRSDALTEKFFGKSLSDQNYREQIRKQFVNIFLEGLLTESVNKKESFK